MGAEEFPQQPTTVFYPTRGGVSVTNRYFTAFGHRYRIDQLSDVTWGPRSIETARRTMVRLVAVEALVPVIIVALAPTLVAVLAALGYMLFGTAMIGFAVYRWPVALEIWAEYRGEPVILYTSTNQTQFHQVKRALSRALEMRTTRAMR
jgi:Family of unknown function (DUF6232)